MIKIKIGAANKELQNDYDEKGHPIASANLQIKRDMSGNYLITDHNDMDITILTKKGRIMTIPKVENETDDTAYSSQNRLYKFLSAQGIIDPTTVQGGNIIGTIEAKMLKPKKDTINPIQVAIFSIGKFIEEERPYFMFKQSFEEKEEERLTDPSEEDSTEFGEVPHQDKQGSIDPAYWANGADYRMYEQMIEESNKDYLIGDFEEGRIKGTYYASFNDRAGRVIIRSNYKNRKKRWSLSLENQAEFKYIKAILMSNDYLQKLVLLAEIFSQKYGRTTTGPSDIRNKKLEYNPEDDEELNFTDLM
jgi:hypothetical protein